MILPSIAYVRIRCWYWMLLALAATAAIYLPGAYGSFVFDDFPNIVDNNGVHPSEWSVPTLISAALSSPSSEFKRPLASLTFAVNYLIGGLNPFGMKITNIIIHLMNGTVAFLLTRLLFAGKLRIPTEKDGASAAIVVTLWLIAPINLTAVLYVVQRMESLANLFVLLGLFGYVKGRRSMIAGRGGFNVAVISLLSGTILGLLAKETAVLTPLYAGLIEWSLFSCRTSTTSANLRISRRVIGLFILVLVIPFFVGIITVGPSLFATSTWAPRNFTMLQRLMSECRIVVDYIAWTLLPMPSDLSFYHDDFLPSTGWIQPWTTLTSLGLLVGLALSALTVRKRLPLYSLGITWFFACHALTATIIPLELIYEHRNYFSSLGLILACVSLLRGDANPDVSRQPVWRGIDVVLCITGLYFASLTLFTAVRWGDPLTMAQELAIRAPDSPRAQYELGRTYIIASKYDASSPLIKAAYDVLERTAALPTSSTLPDQALIFVAAKLHQPIKDAWWSSMEKKLRRGPVTIEDESALISLSSCYLQKGCDLPTDKLLNLFLAALSHSAPRARVFAAYSEFAWSGLNDRKLGYAMARRAAAEDPSEPAYHITATRFALVMDDLTEASKQMALLQALNVGGRLNGDLEGLRPKVDAAKAAAATSPLVRLRPADDRP